MRARSAIVGLLLVAVASAHWLIPVEATSYHAIHVAMRKMFLAPVVLAAVWFGLRGALLAMAGATTLYLPHVIYQWSGRSAENLNQVGEIAGGWLVAAVIGLLVERVWDTRRRILEHQRGRLESLINALEEQLGWRRIGSQASDTNEDHEAA